jgi:RimJ/RimL family protein N-acetyltransferase
MQLETRALTGRFVRLEPLSADVRGAVQAALATDEDAWSIMVSNGGRDGFDRWWSDNLGGTLAGDRLVFAVRRLADDAVVGASGYFSLRPEHRGVEIGSTFYQPDARSGPVNPETKLLLMGHAFDAGAVRVEFAVDAINTRSRAAMTRLGAREEGLLRRHKITWTGRVRDTVIFSVTDEEWPAVRAGLEARLRTFDG